MDNVVIVWTLQAKESLKTIYDFYNVKSERGTKHVINDILNSPKTIAFSKQYQVDEINPNYRRIIVRDFKVLYKESKNLIQIIDVVCTKQSPSKLKNL